MTSDSTHALSALADQFKKELERAFSVSLPQSRGAQTKWIHVFEHQLTEAEWQEYRDSQLALLASFYAKRQASELDAAASVSK